MTRAMVTFAEGPHLELLEIAMPSFETFADEHGYDLLVGSIDGTDRPASWRKVPLLQTALVEYDEVLWVDADVVIVDPSEDLPVPEDAWQAVVAHRTADGEVPNMGVWLVRQPMLPILDRVWGMTQYVNSSWWEQAAVVELMGYRGQPLHRAVASELFEQTCFLDLGWNVHKNDFRVVNCEPVHGRFLHATMYQDRAAVMRVWAERAAGQAVAA